MSQLTTQKPKEEVAPRKEATGVLGFPFACSRLRDEFDQMFERCTQMLTGGGPDADVLAGLEVQDEDDRMIVQAKAPGYQPGDFDIRVSDNRLTVRASHREEAPAKKGQGREVRRQECYHSLALPAGIDRDKVEAQYENGVLSVTLPKTAEGRAKRIAVRGA